LIKDKVKTPRPITEDSTIKTNNPQDFTQCPYCYQIIIGKHNCNDKWHGCSICHINLDKTGKERVFLGHRYISLGLKKHFRLINSLICYNCACKIARMLKE
jgi:hypothetical protein